MRCAAVWWDGTLRRGLAQTHKSRARSRTDRCGSLRLLCGNGFRRIYYIERRIFYYAAEYWFAFNGLERLKMRCACLTIRSPLDVVQVVHLWNSNFTFRNKYTYWIVKSIMHRYYIIAGSTSSSPQQKMGGKNSPPPPNSAHPTRSWTWKRFEFFILFAGGMQLSNECIHIYFVLPVKHYCLATFHIHFKVMSECGWSVCVGFINL